MLFSIPTSFSYDDTSTSKLVCYIGSLGVFKYSLILVTPLWDTCALSRVKHTTISTGTLLQLLLLALTSRVNSLSVALRAGYLSVRTAEGASEKQSTLKARLRNGLTYLLTTSLLLLALQRTLLIHPSKPRRRSARWPRPSTSPDINRQIHRKRGRTWGRM